MGTYPMDNARSRKDELCTRMNNNAPFIRPSRTTSTMLTTDILTTEFERCKGALKSYIIRITANKQDAEDIVQETYIRAHRNVEHFKGDSSVKTWLFAIAQNIARDQLRSLKRWPEDVGDICKDAAMKDPGFFREAMTLHILPAHRSRQDDGGVRQALRIDQQGRRLPPVYGAQRHLQSEAERTGGSREDPDGARC
ncbi:MAG: sigma-70 family RNA polymerase sigma factor [Flavobacteriales bacterium]|nr:sigma-70 family RNA polymerase sigma factor [Flavobacteriales bacterium]